MLALSLRRASLLWVIVSISLLANACGYRHTMTFRSPSGKKSIEVWQTAVDNSWGARVELVSAQRRIVLDEVRREAILYFVHVYWSPDETRVGVLATGFNSVRVGSDTRTGAAIPFGEIREELGKSIEKTYRVPPGEDPIQWAAMADAGSAFFKLHPEIRLSYQ